MSWQERARAFLPTLKDGLNRLALGVGQGFLVVAAATGLILNLMLLWEWGLALSAGAWQPTQGTVVEVSPVVQRARWTYYISITYTHRVGDREYTGYRVCFFESLFGCSFGTLNAIVEAHEPGDAIELYYLPAIPSATVIEPRAKGQLLEAAIAMPVVWLGSAIVILPGYFILKSQIKKGWTFLAQRNPPRR